MASINEDREAYEAAVVDYAEATKTEEEALISAAEYTAKAKEAEAEVAEYAVDVKIAEEEYETEVVEAKIGYTEANVEYTEAVIAEEVVEYAEAVKIAKAKLKTAQAKAEELRIAVKAEEAKATKAAKAKAKLNAENLTEDLTKEQLNVKRLIEDLNTEQLNVKKLTEDLETEKLNSKKLTEDLEIEKANSKKLTEDLKAERLNVKKAEEKLAKYTSEDLGKAMQKRYDVLTKNNWICWLNWNWWLIGIFLCLSLAIALGIFVIFSKDTVTIEIIIARISLLPIFIGSAYFCGKQYTKQKNIIEDYAYKTALANSFNGFARILNNKEDKEDKEAYYSYINKFCDAFLPDPLRERKSKSKLPAQLTSKVLDSFVKCLDNAINTSIDKNKPNPPS